MPKRANSEIGHSGTLIFGGMITETDYNSDFIGDKRINTVELMRKGDGTTRLALQGLKLPIISAKWFITPASDSDEDKKVAAFVEYNLLEHLNTGWTHFLREALSHLEFGYYVFEKVYQDLDFEGQTYIGLKKLAPRMPGTIQAWLTEDGEKGITQHTNTRGTVSIPIEKLLILTNEKEGDNWEGESILRAAYPHFYYKTSYYKIDAIATERQGVGIPRARKTGKEGGAKLKNEEKAKIKEILRNIRANEESYILEPDGITVDFLDAMANSLKNPENMINHHDVQILKSVLLQFLALGQSESGSRAVSEDQHKLFNDALNAVAVTFSDAMNKYVIEQLVDLNFQVENYPKLGFEKIADIDMDKFSTGLQRLLQSKAITSNVNLEQHIRHELGLPELEEDEIAEIEEIKKEDREMKKQKQVGIQQQIKEKTKEATDQIEKQTAKFSNFLTRFSDQLGSTIEKLVGKDAK